MISSGVTYGSARKPFRVTRVPSGDQCRHRPNRPQPLAISRCYSRHCRGVSSTGLPATTHLTTVTWVELNWLHDAELLARIGRSPLSPILDMLALFLAQQNISLPDPRLPDTLYFAELAAILRSQPVKVTAYLPPFLAAGSQSQVPRPPPEDIPLKPAQPCGTATAIAEIRDLIEAVAQQKQELRKENAQLQEENERLRGMQAHGLFDFVLEVEREDFLAFAVIMTLGNPNAASKFLKAPQRTFYDRLERWKTGVKSYQEMLRWIQWRKEVGRKIKLRLPDPKDSGSADDTAVNPDVLHEVVEAIGESSSQNYPSLLREILSVLLAQNPKNWERARQDLVALIKEELPQ